MDELDKLLSKLSRKDSEILRSLMCLLFDKQLKGFDIVKMQGMPYYRLKKGKFRIIFYYNEKGEIRVKTVRIRNEKTYKNL